MGKETEYKLAVGDLQLLDCILCSRMVTEKLCAPYAYIRMRTTYYDTEDGFLEKRRWMLRLRTEDGRSVVTMKTPCSRTRLHPSAGQALPASRRNCG